MDTSERLLTRNFSVQRVERGAVERLTDTVAVEEPLAIRLEYWTKDRRVADSLAVTMRTPGQDRELAAGFLVSEGIVRQKREIVHVRSIGTEPSNEIVLELAHGVDVETWRTERAAFVSAGCGICGKRSREAVSGEIPPPQMDALRVDRSLIEKLPALLEARQQGFASTGGLHAAALVTQDGCVERVFEDIGRHNALDKLIGWCLLNDDLPLRDALLFLSSRSSFELVQKCAMAGARVLATVGGPSSLAIEAAREYGITLIGFVRTSRFNVYSGEWRINL